MKQPEKESFKFQPGTKLSIGDHAVILTEESEVFFDGAHNEENLVGMLTTSKNLEQNRAALQGSYNGFGLAIPAEVAAAQTEEKEPTQAEKDKTEAAFAEVQKTQEALAGGKPVEPLDRDTVPSMQRAPVLGSPELKDVEKMNNMDQIPSQKGFAPLASKPESDSPESGEQPKVNESGANLVDNHAATALANINGAPNTAIADAKTKAGTGEAPPDSALTTDPQLRAGGDSAKTPSAAKSASKTPAKKATAKSAAAKKATPKSAAKKASK